ncbi:preprotein translocase subunit YajC [Microbacterium esteraromaticum]|uniref:Preprotein translocase subunit YajC n=1 Tax=Microbacterium esteraromaticum TaxID=57043 RepID=A0A939DWH3_9MICO|nr:preprotein translocase subunit YajC [Microbacterium esteraromaticum]MBN8206176.1 preprotein translocase subunit YajC [Microbacterium esteraromaticum]MBN8416331.1 preprotein translocase subunit YajC [Microbacterium esteraromaticum]
MEIILFGLLAVMLVFMFMNTRKRQKQMKEQQEEKAAKTIPGAKVLLQGGLYGTVVSYDAVDLDKPAQIELAPGVVIEVHSQAILRVVDPTEETVDSDDVAEEEAVEQHVDTVPAKDATDGIEAIQVETPEETKARLERNDEN